MEIGEKVTSTKLTEDGWTKIKDIAKCSCEIWSKGGKRLMVRVKTSSIYLLWDKNRRR